MMTKRRCLISLLLCAGVSLQMSCERGSTGNTNALTINFTFEQDGEGWQAGFDDYPKNQEAF